MAHLEGARFMEVACKNCELYGAHLETANLDEAHLEGARLEATRFEGKVVPPEHHIGNMTLSIEPFERTFPCKSHTGHTLTVAPT